METIIKIGDKTYVREITEESGQSVVTARLEDGTIIAAPTPCSSEYHAAVMAHKAIQEYHDNNDL